KTPVAQHPSDDNEPQMSKEIPPLANEVSALADISVPTKHVVSQSDTDAQVALGDKYMGSQDYQAAMECYLKAANQGFVEAQINIGIMYYEGNGVPQDFVKAMEWFHMAADQGHAGAQYNIGHMYERGDGVPQDFAKAMEWFRMAADQGDADAQFNIGTMYEEGKGVPQDFAKAMEWYRMAADQGYASAEINIGTMYDEGKGVPQDFAKAMEWYRMAADQGYAGAETNIGTMYHDGKGVPQDFAKAMEWYLKAADQGLPVTQCNIGLMYEQGDGVPQDFDKAMEWYRMAADQGHAHAQCSIGVMYYKSQGMTKNDSEAIKWFQKAAEQGYPNAQEWLKKLSTSPRGGVVYVDIYADRITKEKFILWEDVRLVFHNALHVRHKARVVPFVKDDDFNTYVYGLTTRDSFVRAQNTKQKLEDASVRARNKELARKYAKEAMTKIADTMDLDALHTKGDADPADFWKALECYLKAVHQSHAHAQVQVGDLFFEGQDVSKDSFIAMGWYHKAAFQGDTNAQRKVEALRLSERLMTAAPETPTSSILKAQHNSSKTSIAHPSGDDNDPQMSKETPPLANEVSTLADISVPTKHVASQSDIDAQVVLGGKYIANQDYQAAMKCYLKATKQGHPVGQRRVGSMYDSGEGVTQNYSTAM
ncbi:hypothetical protein EC957_010652, partial [Mortierella hygrophila]